MAKLTMGGTVKKEILFVAGETMGDFIFHKTEVITYLGNPNSSLKPLGYGRASGLCGRL